jgi:hypothetical protein
MYFVVWSLSYIIVLLPNHVCWAMPLSKQQPHIHLGLHKLMLEVACILFTEMGDLQAHG